MSKRLVSSNAVIAALITAAVVLSIFAYNTWYNVPELTYELLPAYPVSEGEQVAAIIVRNEGVTSATDVRIVVSGKGNVTVLPMPIPQEYSITGQDSTVTVTMPRLPPGDKVSFYVRVYTKETDPISSVYVSSSQGMGKERPPSMSPSSWREIANFSFVLITAIAILYILAYVSERVKRQAIGRGPVPALPRVAPRGNREVVGQTQLPTGGREESTRHQFDA